MAIVLRRILATCVALAIVASPALAQSDAAPAAAPEASLEAQLQVCGACHGADGNSVIPLFPILAGQTARYLYLELRDFKAGRRRDPSMDPVVAMLSPTGMLALADWYSKQKPKPTGFVPDPTKVAAGRKKAAEVLCPMCHLGGFTGQNEIPRVAGQHYAYIKKALLDFRAKRRTNDAGSMTSVTSTLSDDDVENLAQYVANLE